MEGILLQHLPQPNGPIASPSPPASPSPSPSFSSPASPTPAPTPSPPGSIGPRNANINRWRAFKICIFLSLSVILIWQMALSFAPQKTNGCNYQVIVDRGGRGDFRTITEAIQFLPNYSPFKICILIREGEYNERVIVEHDKTNLAFIGDGVGRTIILSNQTSDDQPILWTKGKGFVATDLTVKNVAKTDGGVALMNWADHSVFYRCSFESYGITVTADRGSQFYRSCQIYGSNDFIIGTAAAFFQKCEIKIIEPVHQPYVLISRHSRPSVDSRTGFIFHLCDFSTVRKSVSPLKTYLGGPLGDYSKVVVMQSSLDASISGWKVNDTTPTSVSFFEFDNQGAGAAERISSPCVHYMDDSYVASQFTLRVFLEGDRWLSKDIAFDLDFV